MKNIESCQGMRKCFKEISSMDGPAHLIKFFCELASENFVIIFPFFLTFPAPKT